jgi:hypothetical protein
MGILPVLAIVSKRSISKVLKKAAQLRGTVSRLAFLQVWVLGEVGTVCLAAGKDALES